MRKEWIPGKDMDEEMKDGIRKEVAKASKEKGTSTKIIHSLMRMGIYTYEDLKEVYENSGKKIWYDDLRYIGYEQAKILENYINEREGRPIIKEDDEITQLKKQIKELQNQLRIKQKKAIKHGNAWFGVQKYPSTRPDEYYVAIAKEPVEFDILRKGKSTSSTVKVIVTNDKEEAIKRIVPLINDLEGLKQLLIEDEEV